MNIFIYSYTCMRIYIRTHVNSVRGACACTCYTCRPYVMDDLLYDIYTHICVHMYNIIIIILYIVICIHVHTYCVNKHVRTCMRMP